jgi:glyoxylase-like metal-dependent hydrolase (beta-lactamase superfamily II)
MEGSAGYEWAQEVNVRTGDWKIRSLAAGGFHVDGGGVFGTLPRVVWSRLVPPDADNFIRFTNNCPLFEIVWDGIRQVILVDAGSGDKEDEAFRTRFGIEGPGALEASLAAEGYTPADITMLILSHLHFDHAGGATRKDASGAIVPSFPNAKVIVQKRELEEARRGHLRSRASYLPWNWEPLVEAGLLEIVDGDVELLPGLSVRLTPGHTHGMQMVVLEVGGRKWIYPADLMPLSQHVQPAWALAFDLDLERVVDERLRLLDEITGTDTVLLFDHDPVVRAAMVQRDDRGKYGITSVEL